MARAALLCALALALGLVAPTAATDPTIIIVPGTSLGIIPGGGAAGGDALVLNHGEIRGPRDIQCGSPQDPRCDIGAGSTETPGDLVLNYDVGRNVLVYDGHKRLVAKFGAGGIRFYVKPKVRRR